MGGPNTPNYVVYNSLTSKGFRILKVYNISVFFLVTQPVTGVKF